MQRQDKVALMTGAGSGIGKAIAEAFAKSGTHVLVNDVTAEGQRVADAIGGTFLQTHLSDTMQVRDLAQSAQAVHNHIDILVNNTGFQYVSPVEDFPEDVWAAMIHVMLIAPFQPIKHLVPGMKVGGGGRMINISSLHGVVASPYKSAYILALYLISDRARSMTGSAHMIDLGWTAR